MPKVLIASLNPGKLREFRAIFESAGLPENSLEFVLPAELGLDLEVEETGKTFQENASLKSRAFAQASGLLTLADDSGLEVDALGGQPGLYSARYAPQPGATDADRRALLLQNLHGLPRPWTARFRCVIALTAPGGYTRFSEGICSGEVIPTERGKNGFGYDPIFLLPELGLTMAELPDKTKNRLSHRARAANAILPILLEFT